jgi:outer membrane protein
MIKFIRTCASGIALAAACATMSAQQAMPATAPPAPPLTVANAEHLSIERNPRISIARLLQLAQAQVTREARSAELPTATGSLTAVDSHAGSRITAGLLNNPSVYNRAAGGLTVSQLITDFGRTHNLILSAESRDKAQKDAQLASRDDVILAVDQAFYLALSNQAVVKVAEQTVAARQATSDKIGALAASKLRSSLDLSFANVELSQANLLLLDAQDAAQESMANLNALLGSETDEQHTLVDETPTNAEPPPDNVEPLVQIAFASRPDLAALNDSYTASRQFSAAQHALGRPVISALGAVGGTPVRSDQIISSWYGAVGANVNIPIFNGFLFSAQARESDLRASAAQEEVRNLRALIARDVRTSALTAQAAFHRIDVTRQLRDQSNQALDLAQTRYQLGLSGVVELIQAQLAQTEGEISYASARFAYQQALAALRFQTGQ